MNNILQLICIIFIGVELLLLLFSALAVSGNTGKPLRIALGVFGCFFLLIALLVCIAGVLDMFGLSLAFLGEVFYSAFDFMLIWAIVAFGLVIALFAAVSGFMPRRERIKAASDLATDTAPEEEPAPQKRVIEDLFAGLDSADDIEEFLGDTEVRSDGFVEEKIKTLKKLEKLLK